MAAWKSGEDEVLSTAVFPTFVYQQGERVAGGGWESAQWNVVSTEETEVRKFGNCQYSPNWLEATPVYTW